MNLLDPRLIYTILVLPSLFGLTLLGEGVSKMVNGQRGGATSVGFGLMFLGAVVIALLFFLG